MCLRKIIFLILLSIKCSSQNITSIPALELMNIGLKEGISNRIITSISQSKNGLIWVGTEDGLNRIEGHRIKQFFYNTNQQKGVINNSINNLFNADDNKLWIACVNGICYFDYEKNGFYEPDANHKTNLHKSYAPHFCKIKNSIWVFVEGGAYKIDNNNATFYPIKVNVKYHNLWNRIFDVCVDNEGEIWANYGRYILQLNSNNMSIVNVVELQNKKNDGITKIVVDNNNDLWCSTWGAGIIKINTKTKQQFQYKLKDSILHDIAFDKINNRIIACADKGYVLVDVKTNCFEEFKLDIQFNTLFVDNMNNVWFGTSLGVFLHDNKHYTFLKIPLYNTLLKNYVKLVDQNRLPISLSSTKNSYFISLQYANGVIEFDKQWNFKKYVLSLNGDKQNLLFRDIKSIKQKNNYLWVVSSAGLSKCDANLKIISHHIPKYHSHYKYGGIEHFEKLLFLNDSIGVINSSKSFSVFNFKNEKFLSIFVSTNDNKKQLTDNNITDFLLYKNTCFFTTEDGMFKLDFKDNVVSKINLLLPNSRLTSIEKLNESLWIGSQNGLQQLNINTNSVQAYFRNNGLASDHILNLKQENNSLLWIATTNGISYFDSKQNKFLTINEKDGLPDNLIEGVLALDDKNNIVVGNIDRLTIFPDTIIGIKNSNKRTLITELVSHDTVVNWEYKNRKKYIELENSNNYLGIHFSTVGNFFPEKKYYKLNDEWFKVENGFVQLSNLTDGNYNLEVSSEPTHNILNDVLEIRVLPPFYKTIWFWLLICLIIVATIYHIYKIKYKAIQNKLLLQKKFDDKLKESEMKILRSQMNPHFMFNSINSINSFILQNKTDEASLYLTTFSKLMRNILDNSKHKNISLNKEIETLKWYLELESARLEQKFDYKISIEKSIDVDYFKIPPLIIQPFVENAIWHGLHAKKEHGILFIDFKIIENEVLAITIEDNGIGRAASAKIINNQTTHKSFGIEITRDRLMLINSKNSISIKDLYNHLNESRGTQIQILIYPEND